MKPKDKLIAHWRKSDKQAQSLVEHLAKTAEITAKLSFKLGLSEIGVIMGLLHDYGKASKEYQDYLKTNEGLINPDEDSYSHAKRGEVDHSTAGAHRSASTGSTRACKRQRHALFTSLLPGPFHSRGRLEITVGCGLTRPKDFSILWAAEHRFPSHGGQP